MPQALQDILAQLDPVYNPQKQAVQQQIDQLPQQQQAAQAGLDQTKNNSFDQINQDANGKGMYYSGMPINEQAKYLGSTYLPAVANLKNTYADKTSALQQSLLGLTADQTKQAQSVYASESNAEAQAAAQVRAAQIKAASDAQANAGLVSMFSGAGPTQQQPQAPTIQDHLNADIQNLIPKDYASRFLPGYTERQITRLQQAYHELDPNAVRNAVYQYRKQLTGT